MKQIMSFMSFILLFSVTLAFGQTNQSATSHVKEKEKAKVVAEKPQKVSEIRHVVIKGNVQSAKDVQNRKRVRYDEKGGIIVPNASKGIRQTNFTTDQKKLLQRFQKARTKAVERKSSEDLKRE